MKRINWIIICALILSPAVSAEAGTAVKKDPLTGFTEEIETLENEASQLADVIKKHSALLEETRDEKPYLQFEKEQQQLQQEIQSLAEGLRRQKKLLEDKDKENEALKEKIEELTKGLGQQKTVLVSNDTQKEALQEEIKKLTKDLQQQKKIIEGKDKEIAGLQNNLSRDKRRKKNEALNEKITAMEAEMGGMYYQLGMMYAKNEAYEEALKSYESSLQYGFKGPEIYYHLGLLYEHVREDSKRAVSYLEKYLKLDPDGKHKQMSRKLIELLK